MLERSWPHQMLVGAARVAMSRPVWELGDVGSTGIVTGSGGCTTRLPNISTTAALVASCVDGVRVVKPGSFTSRSRVLGPGGLADRLELCIPRDGDALARMLEEHQFAILNTEVTYPWLHNVEVFTIPFLLEALEQASLQPCSANWKVNGVVEADAAVHLARCSEATHQRTLVVHGRTDIPDVVIDDVSTAGATLFLSIDGISHRAWTLEPEEMGITRARRTDLAVPASLSAQTVFVAILDGSAPPAWIDLVAASAAAVLFQARATVDLADGYATARELLRSGTALTKLRRMQPSR